MQLLTEVSCPNCLAPINFHHSKSNMISCGACSSNFILEGHLCPNCTSYYKHEVDNCGRCGTAMSRTCGKCHTSNWAGDEFCKSCGVSMDLIDASIQQFHEQSEQHRSARMAKMSEMRAHEEALSQRRMAELKEADLGRKAEIYARKQARKKQDIIVLMGMMALGVCLLVVGAWIVFTF